MVKGFKVFESCKLVKGFNRSVIYDLQRNLLNFIPNDLYELLIKYQGKTIDEIKESYNNKFDDIIDEYFDFLIKNEFVFFTDTPEWFPNLNLSYQNPFKITNAILDRDSDSTYIMHEALEQLEVLKCKFLEIRFFDKIKSSEVENILEYLDSRSSIISSIGILMPFSPGLKSTFDLMFSNFPRLKYVVFSNSLENKVEKLDYELLRYKVYTKDEINNEKCCGVINRSFFHPNIELFTESLNHNSCLNRKIALDVHGNIKNCPSMLKSFGNINSVELKEALNHAEFKKYWNITKDQIDVCRDCEFRYVCTDCRGYKEDPNNDYSKPLKCGYNPYTNEWKEWSINPLKQKTIEHYGMQELVKKE